MAGAEPGHCRRREHQQAGGKDRRDHARHVDLQRQVRGLVHVRPLPAGLARIVHGDAPLGALHEDHERGDRQDQRHHHDQLQHRQLAIAGHAEGLDHRARQACHDTGEDQQRNAVADAALGDLLTQPHQEHGSRCQADDGRQHEAETGGVDHRYAARGHLRLQRHGDAERLEGGQPDRAEARVHGHRALARLPFLAQLLQAGNDRAHHLHHDRCRNVRHHAEREHRKPGERAAREHVEHVQQAAALADQVAHRFRIDARHRDERTQPVNHQRGDHEEDALAQLRQFPHRAQRIALGCRHAITPRYRRRPRSRPWHQPLREHRRASPRGRSRPWRRP